MKDSIKQFEMNTTFENGQCFRWNKKEDYYIGVAFGEVVKLKELDSEIMIITSGDKTKEFWDKYFFLDGHADFIDLEIAKIDSNVQKALEFGRGMKMLRQEPFETLISFITSSNNNMKRIKLIVERLSERYGKKIEFEGDVYHAFPTPQELINVSVEKYRELGFGYRDKYIYDAVNKVFSGEVDLEKLFDYDRDHTIKELMKIKGVGKKVASCIALFAYNKYDAFPIDVWIKRVLEKMYSDEVKGYDSIDDFIDQYFGKYSGVAQQYLFYYARENKI